MAAWIGPPTPGRQGKHALLSVLAAANERSLASLTTVARTYPVQRKGSIVAKEQMWTWSRLMADAPISRKSIGSRTRS
jgi:hypothetical protein